MGQDQLEWGRWENEERRRKELEQLRAENKELHEKLTALQFEMRDPEASAAQTRLALEQLKKVMSLARAQVEALRRTLGDAP